MHENPKKCPYHLGTSRQKITCAGIVPGSKIHQAYSIAGEEMKDYLLLCCCNYHRCPTAQMLNGIHFRFQAQSCPNNKGVECLHPNQCQRCGWNPSVAQARLIAFMNRQS